MSVRKWHKSVLETASDAGLDVRWMSESTHLVLTVKAGDGTRKVSTSKTPSDHRTLLNFRSRCKQLAREINEATS